MDRNVDSPIDGLQAVTYLLDLVPLIREAALEARAARDDGRSSDDYAFFAGRLSAYYDVVSLIQQQAVAFGIDLKGLGPSELNPDEMLV